MADNDNEGLFSPPTYHRYALSSKQMVRAIFVLSFVVMIMNRRCFCDRLFLIPSNHCQHRRRLSPRGRRTQFVFSVDQRNAAFSNGTRTGPAVRGLPVSIVESLDVFMYWSATHADKIDCAVCLSEFEENEIGRIITKCYHRFHVGCIDMWFYSHDTCPLCRCTVEVEPDKPDSEVLSFDEPERIELVSSSGSCEEGRASSSTVEVVAVPSDEGGFQEFEKPVGPTTSKTTTSVVKTL